MKSSWKITAVLLAAIMMFTGCAGGNITWVFRSGEISIPPGVYIIYEINAFADAEEKISQENENDPEFTMPKTSAILKMTVEGQPVSDWITAKARESTYKHIAVRRQFEAMGLVLSESDIASIESNTASLKSQSGDFYEKNGVSDASIKEYFASMARENAVFGAWYGEGGEYAASEEETLGYFNEKYAMIDALPLYKPATASEGEEKTAEELAKETMADAEEYLRRLKAGEEIETLAYEWELKNTADESKDKVVKYSKGEMRMVVEDSNRSIFGDALIDAALWAKAGESAIVEDSSFIIIFQKIDPASDPDTFEIYKNSLVSGMKGGEYSEKLKVLAASAGIEENPAALGRFKPGKLKMETK